MEKEERRVTSVSPHRWPAPIPPKMPQISARIVRQELRHPARLLMRPPVRTDLQQPVVGREFRISEQAAFEAKIWNLQTCIRYDEIHASDKVIGFFRTVFQARSIVTDIQITGIIGVQRGGSAVTFS